MVLDDGGEQMKVSRRQYERGSEYSSAVDIDLGSHWHIDQRSSFHLENQHLSVGRACLEDRAH